MPFTIRMGIPHMEAYWQELCAREASGTLDKDEAKAFKKLLRAFHHLALNPRYPGLNSHEIDALSRIAGFKIWQSYIENKTPSAGRIFWAYGPGRGEISILAIEPHPEDRKKAGYAKVRLSNLPPME
jgi:hypothetical protein